MQGFTRDYKGIEGITRVYKDLQGITRDYVGFQIKVIESIRGFTRDLQGAFGKVYMGLQGYTRVYRGYTRDYRVIQGINRSMESYMYGLLTKCEVKMAGYWPSSFFFFCVFMDRDEVEVHKLAKKKQKKNNNNEANIQPSWPNELGQ